MTASHSQTNTLLGVSSRFGGDTAIPRAQAEKAMKRDDFTCQCCGFRSLRFQRVVKASALNGSSNRGGGKGNDLVTVCRFCELCFALDVAGATGGGVLIWLPEISQADLNSLMRAIYVARNAGKNGSGDDKLAAAAGRALDALMARKAEAKKRLGSEDPMLLATVMLENLSDDEYAARVDKLEGIRLLPLDHWPVQGASGDHNQFHNMVKYWSSPEGPYAKLPPSSWEKMFAIGTNE